MTREFTVAVFVVYRRRTLLHYHRKTGLWLPPGGHIDEGELPDEAAVREVLEETGVRVHLVGERGVPVEYPRQLVRPFGIQLEDIAPGHQHIDLIYFARPVEDEPAIPTGLAVRDRVGWYAVDELKALGANEEIRAWVDRAMREVH